MDGPVKKDCFIGFKCTEELRLKLYGASLRKRLTLSKFICYALMKYLDSEVSGDG